MQELKDYRERAEGLEKTIQQDRATYERNTSSVSIHYRMKNGIDQAYMRVIRSCFEKSR